MKSSKVLTNLRSEIVQLANLYSKELFVNRLLMASLDLDEEFSKWIMKFLQMDYEETNLCYQPERRSHEPV
jgi:hypothetical protein